MRLKTRSRTCAVHGHDNVDTISQALAPKRGMKLIDALHYATAALAGCKFIWTIDHGFASSDTIEMIHLEGLLRK